MFMHVCKYHVYINIYICLFAIGFCYKVVHIPMYTRIMNYHGGNIVLRHILQSYDINLNTKMTK
jgi:hypothetical protein